jgi:mono/diheme cytochrome c family protein
MTRAALSLALGSILGLLCGCGDNAPASQPEVAPTVASVAHGGQLYDKFWKISEAGEPKDTHPLWAQRPDQTSNKRVAADTWRCKECHAWDYRGVDGAYAQGSHRTGFAGVFGTSASEADLTASLADAHGYRKAGLSDLDLQSLVLFLRQGLVDTTKWIDDNGAFRGDAAKGKALYMKGVGGNKSCNACHGLDGLRPPKGAPADFGDFVGLVANKNPWEFLHKVRFGHPASKMPAAVKGSGTMQDIADLAAFAQSLPKSK